MGDVWKTRTFTDWFGVPSNDDKVNWVELMGAETEEVETLLYGRPDAIDEIIDMVQSASPLQKGWAPSIQTLIGYITKALENAGDEESTKLLFALSITYEKDGLEPLAPNFVGANEYFPSDSPVWTQGTPDGLTKGGNRKVVSIREVLNSPDDAGVNVTPSASPSRENPSLAVIQVFNARKTPASRDTGSAQIFMNAIPTLEFSRCVPYLDVTLIQNQRAIDDHDRLNSVSLLRSLKGNAKVDPSGETNRNDFMLATGVDIKSLDYMYRQLQAQGIAGEEALAKIGVDWRNLSTAGMEIFCSPQTLAVPERHTDYAQLLSLDASSVKKEEKDKSKPPPGVYPPLPQPGHRPASPLDRFRPLAGVTSFNVNVAPSTGFIAMLRAEMSIMCYDRSRLWELSALVKPSVFQQTTKLQITYGWSHPDGQYDRMQGSTGPRMGGVSSTRYNAFGEYLDSLKVTTVFVVTNTSYTFGEDGTVDISLEMVTHGGGSLHGTSIPDDAKTSASKKFVNDLVEAINRIRKNISGKSSTGKSINENSFLNSAASTNSALTMDEETKKKLKKFLESKPSNDPGFKELHDQLKKLYGKKGDGGAVAKLEDTIAGAIAAKINNLKRTPDPFLRTIDASTSFISPKVDADKGRGKRDYVSLGKVMLQFVGQPLSTTHKYEEIQFVFYAFNSKASFVRDFNLAQFPIHIQTFETAMKKFAKTGIALPLSRFMGFLRKEFLSNITTHAYGMRSMYDVEDDGYETKEEFEDNTILANEQRKRLSAAYHCQDEAATEDLDLKLPRIQFQLECLPMSPTQHDPYTIIPEESGKSILRIHVYDAQNVTNVCEAEILKAAFDDTMGLVGKSANSVPNPDQINSDHMKNYVEGLQRAIRAGILEPVDPAFGTEAGNEDAGYGRYQVAGNFSTIKRYVSFNVPHIIFGSNSTAVLQANLQTQNNNLLATISVQRSNSSSPTAAPGVPNASAMPLQLMPFRLSLTLLGCPILTVGQQFFVDFNTGTTADNIYRVHTVTHDVKPGEFKTSVELINMEAYGVYKSTTQQIENAFMRLEEASKGSEETQ